MILSFQGDRAGEVGGGDRHFGNVSFWVCCFPSGFLGDRAEVKLERSEANMKVLLEKLKAAGIDPETL